MRAWLPTLLLAVAVGGACTQEQAGDEPPPEPATIEETVPGEDQESATPSPADDVDDEDDEDADDVADPADTGPVDLQVSDLVTDLATPWAIAVTDDERVFLTERDTGRVLELTEEGETTEVARFDIDNAGEGGLLGLAWDSGSDRLYAYLTTARDNRVIRFDPDDAAEVEVILDGIPKASAHDGGRIAFGPDDLLYIGTGDAGESSRSQDPGSLGGKILRVTPEGAVPDDNPFDASPVYALGLRNVQGLAWTEDGTMYASEFGPDVDDEINRIEAGANYGWPEVTGEAGDERFVDPVVVRQPEEASWSGLVFVSGSAIPQWDGSLLAPSLRGNRLWRIELADDGSVASTEELLVEEHGRLRQALQAPDGSVWVLTNNTDGRGDPAPNDDRILRIAPVG